MGSYQRNRIDANQKIGDDGILHDEVSSICFRVYSAQELIQLSACHVTSPRSFDALHHPISGGLYDLRMGPYSDRVNSVCLTCHLRCEHCPGHLGHIELPLPVCHPLFYQNIHLLLKLTCLACHRFKSEEHIKMLFLVQHKLLDKGLIIAAQQASEFVVLPKKDDERKSGEKDNHSQNIDVAMIVAKLKSFLKQELNELQSLTSKENGNDNTRSVESLRKIYTKDFRSHNMRATCIHCGSQTKSLIQTNSRFLYEGSKLQDFEDEDNSPKIASKKRKAPVDREKTEINPSEIKAHFRKLWGWDSEILKHLFPMLNNSTTEYPTDLFFVEVLGVPPPKMRPCMMTGDLLSLNPQSTSIERVVESVAILKQIMQVVSGFDIDNLSDEARELIKSLKGDTPLMKMDEVWRDLQMAVNVVLDKDMNKSQTKTVGWGLKQLVERKQGLFRMHMMGKRVNFAARTVITPDPNIAIDEIGLPDVFAKKLTYRVPVTPWNVEELRDMVKNGPEIYPGAVYIEEEGGKRVLINANDASQRDALAKTLLISSASNTDSEASEVKTKYVHRHLRNGDAMLLNRQPTLHKPSIMSHRARVLKGERVMRLHYAVCKSYNADFDGDEMNAHFPQNEVARSEAYNIANVCKQYLVPKDGTPLQGLIQDHIIAGVKMTVRGRFFTRAEYQQHVFQALVDFPAQIKILPPAIWKPIALWSGKQIISTIIMNLVPQGKPGPTLQSSAKIKSTEWEVMPPRKWLAGGTPLCSKMSEGPTMSEAEVIFKNGEFIAGILDKNQYGATQFSLVHAFFELYGGEYSGKLQSAFSKLFTNFLHTEGFTLGVKDILVTEEANQIRRHIMEQGRAIGPACAADGVGFKEGVSVDPKDLRNRLEQFHRESRTIPKRRMDIDRAYKEKLAQANNSINRACLPKGLIERFPNNNLQLMVLSGAKGSTVNTMQISCLLGQIELEGKRPPLMISGKSLPSFVAYDTQPRAGGFIDGRFMTGIRPQEFFFHCMAGREGLVDTAVKTSRSGYLQRCLIKLLEGLVVNYDMTVRDSDKSIVQFQYGEDSLDVCKSQYLRSDQLKFLFENKDALGDVTTLSKAIENMSESKKKIEKYRKTCKKWITKNGQSSKIRSSGFAIFSQEEMPNEGNIEERKRYLMKRWRSLGVDERQSYEKKASKCPDPVTGVFRPDSNFGSVTETIDDMIEKYLSSRNEKDKLTSGDEKEFKKVMYLKFQQSLVEPGEPVGVLAAQSVGEPSTQMTLNTFHFAGRGEMNVTLGIPRLREILMVASVNIKTPTMTIPFLPHVSKKEQDHLRTSLNRVTLADVLSEVIVTEGLHFKGTKRERRVKIKFEFLPRKSYSSMYCVNPSKILAYFEKTFISKVFLAVLSTVIHDKKVVVESSSNKSKKETDEPDMDQDDEPNEEAEIDRMEREGVGEGHASSDEEELADDADATETRKKNRQMDEEVEIVKDEEEIDFLKEMAEAIRDEEGIEGGDDEDQNESGKADKTFDDLRAEYEDDDGFGEMVDELPDIDNDEFEAENRPKPKQRPDPVLDNRRMFVLNMLQGKSGPSTVVDYTYDAKDELWCELVLSFGVQQRRIDMSNVIRKSAQKAVIHEVKNIKRAFSVKTEKGEDAITTEGVNVDAMFARETLLDIRRLFCNNIHDMAKYYGIEAANKTIVREITNVFKAYGIEVNPRHLTLVADFMTFDGTYKPFNRVGIENNPSPLQQMTFETAVGFLRAATLGGKCDSLDSPSSRLVVGKPCLGGTNTFGMRQQLMGAVREEDNGKRFCIKS